MKFCFFDSSALVKRYVQEAGTQRVQELAASAVIFVSRVTWVEVLSAFARLSRERKADPARLFATRQLFQHDWRNQYQIVELNEEIADRAGQLVQRHILRAYDSFSWPRRSVCIRCLSGLIRSCSRLFARTTGC